MQVDVIYMTIMNLSWNNGMMNTEKRPDLVESFTKYLKNRDPIHNVE